MPWQECTVTDQRREFVALARQEGVSMRELCRRFGISPKTGYKLLHRVEAEGAVGLVDRSRRPHTSPHQTPPAMVDAICALRRTHPRWGARKLHHRLRKDGMVDVPAPSTMTAILKREGLLGADDRPITGVFCRFEHAAPNDLWQLDFMGHKPLRQGRVHPLTVIDDHSRYLLTLRATATEDLATVQPLLIACFRHYGLPWAILTDNGPPWGRQGAPEWTTFEVWLLRLGIAVRHGRPYHPQTQGKVERVHGTINAEVFGLGVLPDLDRAQVAFDAFRQCYNHERPHESLAYAVPADRYRISVRPYPETLPQIDYADDVHVRRVGYNGTISFAGRRIQIGAAFRQLPVGVVATAADGVFRVQFAQQPLGRFDLRQLPKGQSRCYLCP